MTYWQLKFLNVEWVNSSREYYFLNNVVLNSFTSILLLQEGLRCQFNPSCCLSHCGRWRKLTELFGNWLRFSSIWRGRPFTGLDTLIRICRITCNYFIISGQNSSSKTAPSADRANVVVVAFTLLMHPLKPLSALRCNMTKIVLIPHWSWLVLYQYLNKALV